MQLPDNFAANLQERAMRAKNTRATDVAIAPAKPEVVRGVSNTKARPTRNLLPNMDELSDWIDKATHALSRGVVWERGSILNVLV